jgi:transcriptional regulator with XRE-family HTH domain
MPPPLDLKALIARRLRQYRALNEMTQRELAQRGGLRTATVSDIERAIVTPDLDTAWKLADALAVSLDELVGRSRPSRKRLFCAGRRQMTVQMAPMSAMSVSIDEAEELNYELVRRTVRTIVVALGAPSAHCVATAKKLAEGWFDSDIIWMASSSEGWPLHDIADALAQDVSDDGSVDVSSLNGPATSRRYASASEAYEALFKLGTLTLPE